MKMVPSNFKVVEKKTKTSKFVSYPITGIGLAVFLLIIMGIGIIPGYFRGAKWSWFEERRPSNLAELIKLKKKGFSLANWNVIERNWVAVGDKEWLRQIMSQNSKTVEVLVLPQIYHKDKPSVEWTDLENTNVYASFCYSQMAEIAKSSPEKMGLKSSSYATISQLLSSDNLNQDLWQDIARLLPESCQSFFSLKTNSQGVKILIPRQEVNDWQTKSRKKVSFTNESGKKITAILERGWSKSQTFAILNWYDWQSGGHFEPGHWFWQDLKAQLSQDRAGWVAISLRIPISATEKIDSVEEQAKILAGQINHSLRKQLSSP